jgi:hypothetical protein
MPRSSELYAVESLLAQGMEEALGDIYSGPVVSEPSALQVWKYSTVPPNDLSGDLKSAVAAMVLEVLEVLKPGQRVSGSLVRLVLLGSGASACALVEIA